VGRVVEVVVVVVRGDGALRITLALCCETAVHTNARVSARHPCSAERPMGPQWPIAHASYSLTSILLLLLRGQGLHLDALLGAGASSNGQPAGRNPCHASSCSCL